MTVESKRPGGSAAPVELGPLRIRVDAYYSRRLRRHLLLGKDDETVFASSSLADLHASLVAADRGDVVIEQDGVPLFHARVLHAATTEKSSWQN